MYPQGRLTATMGVSTPTTDVASATTIYYTWATGLNCPIWNGSAFVDTQFWAGSDLSNILANSSTGNAGPAAVVANSNYDLFVWSCSGTATLTRGPAWTSGTSRGTGAGTTQLQVNAPCYTNAYDITNGPLAGYGTYVGSIRTNGTATADQKFGSMATGGGAASIGVWSAYNQHLTSLVVQDQTSNWSYSGGFRNANGSTGNRASFIQGLPSGSIQAVYSCQANVASSSAAYVGWGFDASTPIFQAGVGGSIALCLPATIAIRPQVGWHYIQAIESSTSSSTFVGNGYQNLTVQIWI